MSWGSVTGGGTGPLVFIDDVTADRSIRMFSGVYRAILSGHNQPNAAKLIGQHIPVQMDDDPEYSVKICSRLVEGKEMEYSSMAKSVT